MSANNTYSRFWSRVFAPLLLLTALPGWTGMALAIEVRDDENSLVTLAVPASRIISLAPSLTELLFAAGAGDRIVGVVEYSDFPEAAKSIPVIGRYDMLDMERILALQPDLIVAWKSGNPRAAVLRLKAFGLNVYIAEPTTLQSISAHIGKLATLSGTEASAADVIKDFNNRLISLQNSYSGLAPVRVFYQVWDAPLTTAGGNELLNDIISLCGGQNIFAELASMAPKVSEEAVLARNPEVIIASGMDQSRPEWLDRWMNWTQLTAVANDQLHFIPPDLLQRHTPRALDGAMQMCEQIQTARKLN